MARRSSLPSYLALFAVPFILAATAAYGVRSWSNASTSVLTEAVPATTAPTETTVPATTPLTVETSLPPADTTVPTVPDTTIPPESTLPPPPPLPNPPTDGSGAILRPLGDQDRRLFDEAAGCNSLARTGTTAQNCDITTSHGVDVAWVSMDAGLDVLTHADADGPDVWKVVLRSNTPPSRSPLFADVLGDGEPVLVAGWRDADGSLAFDVVEFDPAQFPTPAVTLHASMLDGRVSVAGGRLEAWEGLVAAGGDPTQPTSYVHWTFSGGGPQWKAAKSRDDSPPAGQL